MSNYLKDLGTRVAAVFVLGFLSAFSFTDMSTAKTAAVAGASAAGQLLIGLLAKRFGDPESAGFHK